MTEENKEFIGKALLFVGGFAVVGSIIQAYLEEEEPTREVPQNSKGLKLNKPNHQTMRNLTKDSLSKKKRIYKVEVPVENRGTLSSGEPNQPLDRKYPPDYYKLNKNQQYKFRKKLANSLYQISTEK